MNEIEISFALQKVLKRFCLCANTGGHGTTCRSIADNALLTRRRAAFLRDVPKAKPVLRRSVVSVVI
jgi:hypothetical protein